MSTNCLKKVGRSCPSTFCLVRAKDRLPVEIGTDTVEAEDTDVMLALYVLYFCTHQRHSGPKAATYDSLAGSWVYVMLLPARVHCVHNHTVLRFKRSNSSLENAAFHRILPITSSVQPLIEVA